jgi:hypothetical protein
MFSTILDISSFFIGMLINLLLIALICYYFKRKYEALELSQNEQAKILYNLIQNQTPKPSFNINELMTNTNLKNSCSLSNCVEINCSDEQSDESDSDNESNSDSDNESNSESNNQGDNKCDNEEVKTLSINTLLTNVTDVETEELHNITVTKIEEVEILETPNEMDYNKLSIKQLKDILSKKGINSNNRMKKNDLISLIEKGSVDKELETLDLKDELSEVNI